MAGHSKWANIKHKKAKEDAKRAKIFTRHIREITVAAREGGDPDGNPRLKMAIENAKSDNLPKDNIERAIKKGTGELNDGSANYEEITYEGYGPGGIAYMVEATTENKNRTVGDMRYLFGKYGGKLGQEGSVDYLFEQKGIIKLPADNYDSEEFMLTAIDAGAEDVEQIDDYFEVKTTRQDLVDVRQNLENEGFQIESAELKRIPMAEVKVDQDTALSNFKLMDELDDNDDVSYVFTNMQMDDETLSMAENV